MVAFERNVVWHGDACDGLTVVTDKVRMHLGDDLEVAFFVIGLEGAYDALFDKFGDISIESCFVHRDTVFELFITDWSILIGQYL